MDSLECDFCYNRNDVIMIRIQSSQGDINEYNICNSNWCKTELFGELRRFLIECRNHNLIKNEFSYRFIK